MRVLVTGGNRYIGLELVFELARQGHDVTVMNSHEAPLPQGARRLHGDRQVPGTLEAVLGPYRDEFDVVFDNTAYEIKDIAPMIELFSGRVRQYVFTSSTAVYRRNFIQPVRETSRRHDPADEDPRKHYGVHKVRCEDHLLAEFERNAFPATVLRVSHTLGPRSPLVTRDPIFFARLEQNRPIFVPGEGYSLLSMIHTRDVARLMVSLIGNARVPGQAYNVAGVEVTSIVGAVHAMAKAVGVKPHIVNVPLDVARTFQPPLVHWGEGLTGAAIFAVDKALTDLDWRPMYGIESGYADSYEWFRTEGRDRYEYDFARDEEILAKLR